MMLHVLLHFRLYGCCLRGKVAFIKELGVSNSVLYPESCTVVPDLVLLRNDAVFGSTLGLVRGGVEENSMCPFWYVLWDCFPASSFVEVLYVGGWLLCVVQAFPSEGVCEVHVYVIRTPFPSRSKCVSGKLLDSLLPLWDMVNSA